MSTISAPLNPEPSRPEERMENNLAPKSYATAVEEGPTDFNGAAPVPELKGTAPEPSYAEVAAPDDSSTATAKTHSPAESDSSSRTSRASTTTDSQIKFSDDAKLVYERFQTPDGELLTSVKPADNYEENLKHSQKLRGSHKQDVSGTELVSGRRAGAGWERSSIRWAPLNVPLQRRLQTFVVLCHTLTIPIFLTLFFWFCAVPLFWPILIPYLVWIAIFSTAPTDGTLTGRMDWLRRSKVWSLYASYFPARLHRSQELPPTRKYIFGYHPHGIISHGAFAAFATDALGFSQLFPGITNTLLTLEANFRIPLYRNYALAMGINSVSRESCENILSKGGLNNEGMGRAITIVIGGARESLDAKPDSSTLKLILKSRKGFVKMAIRTGADLVPVLAFGENDLYDQLSGAEHPFIHKMQMLVKKFAGFTVPLFHARGVFNYDVGLMPYRRAVNVVVGRPIQVQRQGHRGDGDKIDMAYVDELHAQYVQELERLWEEWKGAFVGDWAGNGTGAEGMKLELVD